MIGHRGELAEEVPARWRGSAARRFNADQRAGCARCAVHPPAVPSGQRDHDRVLGGFLEQRPGARLRRRRPVRRDRVDGDAARRYDRNVRGSCATGAAGSDSDDTRGDTGRRRVGGVDVRRRRAGRLHAEHPPYPAGVACRRSRWRRFPATVVRAVRWANSFGPGTTHAVGAPVRCPQLRPIGHDELLGWPVRCRRRFHVAGAGGVRQLDPGRWTAWRDLRQRQRHWIRSRTHTARAHAPCSPGDGRCPVPDPGCGGSLSTTFSGLPAPLCAPLGACGDSGRLVESIAADGSLSFSAARIVPRPVSAAAALRDLRSGRMRLNGFLGVSPAREAVSETLAQRDGTTCTGSGSAGRFDFEVAVRRRGDQLQLTSPGGAFGVDPLRTRCPGPSAADVLGNRSEILAAAPLAPSELGRRHLTLSLSAAGTFSGLSWSGRRGGTIVLMLTRVRERAGTHRVRLVLGEPGVTLP